MKKKLTGNEYWWMWLSMVVMFFGGMLMNGQQLFSMKVDAGSILSSIVVDIDVKGVVKDKAGPLPGVSVTLKTDPKVGTTTDVNGNYNIKVPANATLVFKSIGYKTIEFPVNNRTSINVTMEDGVSILDEVIVVGYGTQKKSDLTGSMTSIKGADLTMLPTQRVDQALQGRAAGVMVLNTDGAPGGNTTIRIRGMNSIQGGNNALIVIDGLQGGNLNSLNPNDIESMDILKDASATAIYGSQGANGVILITTKKGKIGKPIINYTYDGGTASLRKKMELLSAADYATNINANVMANNGAGRTPIPLFTEAEIQKFETSGGTDWQDVIYRNALTQNHQLSVSGATDRMNYLVSGGYLDQEGILLNSAYKRFSLRANVTAEINKWANFGLNWAGSRENSNSILFGGSTDWPNNPIGAALKFSPTISVYDTNNNYSRSSLFYGNSTLWNPLASTVEPMTDNNTLRNNMNGFLEFKPLQGLTLKITGGAILSNQDNQNFLNSNTFIGLQSKGSGAMSSNRSVFLQNSNILTYDKTLKAHHLTFTAVAEQIFSKNNSSNANGEDFLIQQTGIFDLRGASIVTNSSSITERAINSYLGRINYVLADKYLFTFSYRADGSSVFGKNNKWGHFPSVAAAWRASEETFIKNLDLFSDLKLRASWGITGNQGISPYQTLARVSSGGNYPYNGGDATELGFFISAAANPFLKWESTTQTNLGVDVGMFNGRLVVTADVYDKVTKDLLMARELPRYTGLNSLIDNVGSMGNKGIEFAVSGDPLVGNFKWNVGFNVSFNKTKVLDLGGIDRIGYKSGGSGQSVNFPFMYLIKGERFGQMVGWGYEGVWQESQSSEAAKYGQLPGDPHYTDLNLDGKINPLDVKVIGNSMPDFIFGLNNRMAYKNLELIFQIQGSKGNDLFNVARIALDASNGTSTRILDRWTSQNPGSNVPGIIDGKTREAAKLVNKISFPTSDGNRLSRWVEDASYLRLKNITLAYNLPKSLSDKVKLNNVRMYMSGTNLLTFTNYTGYDPEVSSFTGNDSQLGSDFNNYPQSKIVNLGINVSL